MNRRDPGRRVPVALRWVRVAIAATLLPVSLSVASPEPTAGPTPVRLMVTGAYIFTLAEGDAQPFVGHLVVAQDGSVAAIGPGEPCPESGRLKTPWTRRDAG